LTPIEERWEAIEECELQFRASKIRVSTDHIGLARAKEGLELVRIGTPQRLELASWRYGDQFGRRRRHAIVKTSAGVIGLALMSPLGAISGLSIAAAGVNAFNLGNMVLSHHHRMRIVAHFLAPDGTQSVIRNYQAQKAALLVATPNEPWGLLFPRRGERHRETPWWRYDQQVDTYEIRGDLALRLAGLILPLINSEGSSKSDVDAAVDIVERFPDPTLCFTRASSLADKSHRGNLEKRGMLAELSPELRLALEMVSHEDSERRAFEGELNLLEGAWRDAEEIASISDDMFLPDGVTERLMELRRRAHEP
jgi:hypothetical protein